MFEPGVLEGFKTVGSFILYKDTLAFMIGPDHTGERLGIMRLGGHIEENENLLQALEREIEEEGAVKVRMLDSPRTYFLDEWDNKEYYDISNKIEWDTKPLIIKGNSTRSTAVFLSVSKEEPKPSSEACGIIFLKENDIERICTNKLCINDFINNGGKLVQQKDINYDMEMYAGVHLRFLYRLMKDHNDLVHRYFSQEL